MTPCEIVARAKSALGKGTIYALGRGGRKPESDVPHDSKGRCDCSGFVSWAMGLDRYQPGNKFYKDFNGGWISTTSMVRDTQRIGGFLVQVRSPWPGDVVVYGDYVTAAGKKHQGHCGIVTQVPDSWDGNFSKLRVIHCSASRSAREAGSAIQETDATGFEKRGIFARFSP